MASSKDIRRQFIEFFTEKHGHTYVPSSPVVPLDDPTLLFTNAGMNQFKPIFLGQEKRDYVRAVNTQKCIRAGGKHNDLDDVGKDTYHHTFFEMLGNWSFGDYFKAEAIQWAWELLTKVWGLDKSRLHATVFMGDPAEGLEADREAAELWRKVTDINPDHIHLGNKKDNFWEMGNTGPCGPCSEIHIDLTPDKSGARLVNGGDPRVMEIWNLVFIQFNRGADGKLQPLPARHIDTGMGFERICAVIQQTGSNYDTDVFSPLMSAIGDLAGAKYGRSLEDPKDIAFRVVADHLRMSSFAIADGGIPSNKGRGSVLRSVIRRAVRYGYQEFKLREPFMHRLVPALVDQMGDVFPELRQRAQAVQEILRGEEADFLEVIDRGLEAFEDAARRAAAHGGRFGGEDLHHLHSTLGFPADMAMQLARDRGLTPDVEAYERIVAKFKEESGRGRKQHHQIAVDLTVFPKTDDSHKYTGLSTEATVAGFVTETNAARAGRLREDAEAALVLNRTTFYAEAGGQVGDVGTITTATGRFDVRGTERKGDVVLHWGEVAEGHIEVGQQALVSVDSSRHDTMRNHTATHLLNWALRKVLGDHVDQKGSLVDAEKLRFDFSHDKAVTPQEIAEVERLVNEKIYADLPVSATIMPLAEAKKLPGVRAVFGEKYPDPVRVISIGTEDPRRESGIDNSIEFCGGTHLRRTGEAGFFKIVEESAVSKGVRRLTAVTGPAAVRHVQSLDAAVRQITQTLSAPLDQVPARIAALQEEIKSLKKKLATGGAAGAQDPKAFADSLVSAPPGPIVAEYKSATPEQMLAAIDSIKKRRPAYAVLLASAGEDKVSFVAAVSDEIIAKGLKAGDWVKEAAKPTGGSGGGRPNLAQAGGKDPSKLAEALEAAKAAAAKVGA
jgi:alanyl-tRNA synthetase